VLILISFIGVTHFALVRDVSLGEPRLQTFAEVPIACMFCWMASLAYFMMDMASTAGTCVRHEYAYAEVSEEEEEKEFVTCGRNAPSCIGSLAESTRLCCSSVVKSKPITFAKRAFLAVWPKITSFLAYFLSDRAEYSKPSDYGWRVKWRRGFLVIGTLLFTCVMLDMVIWSLTFNAKEEIQKMLVLAGFNLTWPDEPSALDDVFVLYNRMEWVKACIMIVSTLLFWVSTLFDFIPARYGRFESAELQKLLLWSRLFGIVGGITVFGATIAVGLPNYVEATHLDKIIPFCGGDFNRAVHEGAELVIGLFFASLFTLQLVPVLVAVVPALVRACALSLIHPGLQVKALEYTFIFLQAKN
jgi:hypothetical protein